jgi:hypothetical protein
VIVQFDVGGVVRFITLLPDQDVMVSIDGGESGCEQVSDEVAIFALP